MRVTADWLVSWGRRTPRERRAVILALSCVVLALYWAMGLRPALQMMARAPERQQQLDRALARMSAAQTQAETLRALPVRDPAIARQVLAQLNVSLLGPRTEMLTQGAQVTIRLQGAPAQGLALWLVRAREQAGMTVLQAHIVRDPSPSPASIPAWSGTLMLSAPDVTSSP